MLLRCRKPIETCAHPPNSEFYDVTVPEVGKFRGQRRVTMYHETYYAFENIPYGYQPVDRLRFKAPWEAEVFPSFLKNCTKPGKTPIQMNEVTNEASGHEDCLNLNIYVKNIHELAKYPVMVYIYGGDFVEGKATDYQPDYFMFENVVFITLNYRVGILGFLTMKDFELEVPGNAGLKDILLALKWIHKNCVYFNGDSRRVCLFGSAAGAGAVHILSCTKPAKGLFQKVILQSGSMLCQWCYLPQSGVPYRIALSNGYNGPQDERHILAFLRLLPAEALGNWKVLGIGDFQQGIMHPFAPTIEPYEMEHSLIRKPYLEMMTTAWGNRLPMMIGGTSFEGLYVFKYRQIILEESEGNLLGFIESALLPPELKQMTFKVTSQKQKKLVNFYFNTDKDSQKDIFRKLLDLTSIRFFWHGMHRTVMSRHKYASGATYQYRFDFDSPEYNLARFQLCSIDIKKGVAHGDDLYYLFRLGKSYKVACDTPEYQTKRRMVSMWYSFAAHSNPNYTLFKQDERVICEGNQEIFWRNICQSNVYSALNISYEMTFDLMPEEKILKFWDTLYDNNLY